MMNEIKFTQNDYKIIERKVLYQGIFRIARYTIKHQLFSGQWSGAFEREVFERHSAVGILPYDPHLDRVILIEQFRPGGISDPQSPWLIEIPAGIFDKDEKPEEVAFREAQEEAGCLIQLLHPIFKYFVSPGGSNEYIHIFCGKIDSQGIEGIHGLANEHEDIRVWNLTTDDAIGLMNKGKIKTAPALISLLWLQLHRQQLQESWGQNV